jgi:hypothetical protein
MLMLVTDDGFKLKAETRSIFCVLKLSYKAVVVVVVTLLPYLLFISILNVTISNLTV